MSIARPIFRNMCQPLTGATEVTTPPATYVFLLAGQSNMVGRASFDGGATYPANALQYDMAGALVPAVSPLDHHDEIAGQMGLALQFALDWASTSPDNTLVFVPAADAGTGFSDGKWGVGDPLYAGLVARANALFAANPAFRLGGILWHQGETDAVAGSTTYQADLDAMIAGLRSDIAVARASTPFILGELAPNFVTVRGGGAINDIIADTPNRLAYTTVVSADGLADIGDNTHFDAVSLRTLGSRYYAALATAAANVPQAPVISGVPTISGTEQVGEVLTATAATPVTGIPSPTGSWQWKRGGVNIGGAISATYILQAADEGATLTVVQTETNSAGTDSAESVATGVIAAAPVVVTTLTDDFAGLPAGTDIDGRTATGGATWAALDPLSAVADGADGVRMGSSDAQGQESRLSIGELAAGAAAYVEATAHVYTNDTALTGQLFLWGNGAADDAFTGYALDCRKGQLRIFAYVSGSLSVLSPVYSVTLTEGAACTMRLECETGAQRVYLDGALVLTTNDGSVPGAGGHCGIGWRSSLAAYTDTTGVHWLDVEAGAL